jgi:hypothetical protein
MMASHYIGIREPHTGFSQLVNIRGLYKPVAITAQGISPEVIGQDKEYIWLPDTIAA